MVGGGHIAGFGFSVGDVRTDLSDLDGILTCIEEVGASHCELNLARYELVIDGRIVPERVARFRRICGAHALRYTAHGALAVNFMDEDNLPFHKTVFGALLDLAVDVGAEVIVHHPGIISMRAQNEIERLHRVERDTLAGFAQRATAGGIKIGVETLFVEDSERYTADPFRLADEIEAIGHPNIVGTLDFSHALIHSAVRGYETEMTALHEISEFRGRLFNVSFGR